MYHAVDIHIGQRLRVRRLELGLTQLGLAKKLGISWQQVQKYETGNNRISGSRLWDIAAVVEQPVGYFFVEIEGGFEPGTDESESNEDFFEIARAVQSIENEAIKLELKRLVKSFCKLSTKQVPRPSEALEKRP